LAAKTAKTEPGCRGSERQQQAGHDDPPNEKQGCVEEPRYESKCEYPAEECRKHGAQIGWNLVVKIVQFGGEQPENPKNARPDGDSRDIPHSSSKRRLQRRTFRLEAVVEIDERSSVQDQYACNDCGGEQDAQNQLPRISFRNAKPADKREKQDGVAEKLNQPEPPALQAPGEGVARCCPLRHYFTSNVAASLVARTDG